MRRLVPYVLVLVFAGCELTYQVKSKPMEQRGVIVKEVEYKAVTYDTRGNGEEGPRTYSLMSTDGRKASIDKETYEAVKIGDHVGLLNWEEMVRK